MQVVILSEVLPYPLASGGAEGIFSLLDVMRRHHHITFVFPENGQNTLSATKTLQALWPEVDLRPYRYYRQLTSARFFFDKARRAFSLKFRANSTRFQVNRILKPYGYYMTRDFRRFFLQILEEKKTDLVQVEFFPYLSTIDFLPPTVPRLFLHHEIRAVRNDRMLQPFTLTAKERSLRERVRQDEFSRLSRFDAVMTLTENDATYLRQHGVTAPLYVSPLPITARLLSPTEEWNGHLMFVGGFTHGPNVEGMQWFLQEVAPKIDWQGFGQDVQLDVVGRGWTQAWLHKHNHSPLTVHPTGFIADLSTMATGSLMIVPILSGSGMRMKILYASALATPLVSTRVGAEGLCYAHENGCLLADTAEAFAASLTRLMHEAPLRKQLATQAQTIFLNHYSQRQMAEIRTRIWHDVVQRFHA